MEKIEMRKKPKTSVIEEGMKVLFKELGTIKAIKFLQSLGINKGDSVKEIESITEKLSREEALSLLKKTEGKLTKKARQRLETVRKTPTSKYVKL